MPELELDPIEELLEGHLERRLDPHLGKAAQAFAAHVGEHVGEHRGEAAPAPLAASHRFIFWWAPAIGALAACVMVGLLLRARYDRPVATGPVGVNPVPAETAGTLEIQRTISWQNFDEGTFMMDEQTPVRRVRRQVLETSQWYDPARQSMVEVSLPREEVMLIGLSMQ